MSDFGRINNELHVDREEECGLVSNPVWVHLVDGHFMIEPVPDPFMIPQKVGLEFCDPPWFLYFTPLFPMLLRHRNQDNPSPDVFA